MNPAAWLSRAHWEVEQRALLAAAQAPLRGPYPGLQIWLPGGGRSTLLYSCAVLLQGQS